MRVSDLEQASERGTTTRNLLNRIANALEITDLIALMMAVATGLSAYATWKTAQLTNEILLTSQRPYVGIESVHFAAEANPSVVADLRNFGTVQAEDAIIRIVLKINGRALPAEFEPQQQATSIVLSPAVPHPLYRHLSADAYHDVVQGKANLIVEVRVRYKGPRGDEHCYVMRHSYDHMDRVFYPLGGSLGCEHESDTVLAR